MKYSVCKDCVPPERFVGCHSVCHKYIEEKEKIETEKETIRMARKADNDYYSFHYTAVKGALKRAGRAF